MSKRIRPILAVAFTMVLGIAAAENFDAALRRGIERRALAPSRATGNPMVIINLAMQIADRLQHGAPAAGKKEAEPESTPSIASPPREENLIRSFF
jgi:hypothetical protein